MCVLRGEEEVTLCLSEHRGNFSQSLGGPDVVTTFNNDDLLQQQRQTDPFKTKDDNDFMWEELSTH